jgi:hypothetical protein
MIQSYKQINLQETYDTIVIGSGGLSTRYIIKTRSKGVGARKALYLGGFYTCF